MNEKALKTLEYDKIIERLTEHAATYGGKQLCRDLVPMTDLDEIRKAQAATSAAESRIIANGSLSFAGVQDIGASVKRLEIGSTLGTSELLAIASLLEVALRAKNYGRRDDRDTEDCLDPLFSYLEPLPPLCQEIRRCILSPEEIADDASPGLRSVRRAIRATNDKVHTQLNSLLISTRSYLQDGVVTMRDGRYCLPVKAEYKSSVSGLIHDQSGSGSTYFIEPMAIVKLNNELKELSIREQKEIEAVLADLSNRAAEHTSTLMQDYSILVQLDFTFAKAQLSRSYKGVEPIFNNERRINIKQGRHPLLAAKKVVPIDVYLGDAFDLLVITGPNTGGKTVTLKTIGLLTLLGESGLHIPAGPGSTLAIFTEVYADIGDEQSIEQSLSTFSSHMTNIVRIMDKADEDSLVLFDELGAGTDPTEGAALAMAILTRLHRMGIRTVATTHYSELKLFALSTDGVENASCEFDVATLRPTYRLLIGVPGKSNAFAISKKLGLSDDIIEEARESIGAQDEAFEDVIADLEAKRIRIEAEAREAAALRAEIESLKKELAEKQSRMNEQKDHILREARDEAHQILLEAKESADKAIRAMNKAGVRVSKEAEAERSALRAKLDATATGLTRKKANRAVKAAELHVGDTVRVISLNLKGTVQTLPDNRGNLAVQMGILRSNVHISDVELMADEEEETGEKLKGSQSSIKMNKSLTVATELNLIGMRVDEAMPILDKYLDDSYLAHIPSVRIIHGRGTGALKSAVQSMLRKNKHIAKYRAGEYGEGGNGVTIVEFK